MPSCLSVASSLDLICLCCVLQLAVLGRLRSLQDLVLGECALVQLPACIVSLPQLRRLKLLGNLLTTLPAGPYLSHLTALDISWNRYGWGACSKRGSEEAWPAASLNPVRTERNPCIDTRCDAACCRAAGSRSCPPRSSAAPACSCSGWRGGAHCHKKIPIRTR